MQPLTPELLEAEIRDVIADGDTERILARGAELDALSGYKPVRGSNPAEGPYIPLVNLLVEVAPTLGRPVALSLLLEAIDATAGPVWKLLRGTDG